MHEKAGVGNAHLFGLWEQAGYICVFQHMVCKMGTPATALASVIHSAVVWFGVLWVSALVISRVYMFHDEYQRIVEHTYNDQRLRQMCADPEFLAIMKQHNDICTEVQHDAQINPWLRALDKSLNSATLCGGEACMDILGRWCVKGGWTGVGCCILVILFMPHVLMRFVTLSFGWSGSDMRKQNVQRGGGFTPSLGDYSDQW